MAQKKYFYNPETCQYEPIKVRKSDVIIGGLAFVVVVLLLAIVMAFVFNIYYDTESEAKLKKDNKELRTYLVDIKKGQEEIGNLLDQLKARDLGIYKSVYETDSLRTDIIPESIFEDIKDDLLDNGLSDEQLVTAFKNKIDFLNKQAKGDLYDLSVLAENKLKDAESFKFIPTIQPVDNPDHTALASGYGIRMNPYHHGMMDHKGIDFAAPRGSNVYSTAHGTVKSVNTTDSNTGYGNKIEIDHGNGLISRFAHLDEIKVKPGQKVTKGMIIGTVGTSGGTIAPCVHYEIIRNGRRINPIHYLLQNLNEKDYMILLELAIRENQSLD